MIIMHKYEKQALAEAAVQSLLAPAEEGDREAAEAAVLALYEAAGLARPFVIHATDPCNALITWALLPAAIGAPAARIVQGRVMNVTWETVFTNYENLRRYEEVLRQAVNLRQSVSYQAVGEARAQLTPQEAITRTAGLRNLITRGRKEALAAGAPATISYINGRIQGPNGRNRSGFSLGSQLHEFVGALIALMQDNPAAELGLELMQHASGVLMARDVVIIIPRPAEIHTRYADGGDDWNQRYVLHQVRGPAIRWDGGVRLWRVNGTEVPEHVAMGTTTFDQFIRITNAEVRRAVTEIQGWEFIIRHLTEVSREPDPASLGKKIVLYDLPARMADREWVSDEGARMSTRRVPRRLVVMTNASPDRSGADRVYGEMVPATCETALAAQAWAWGVTSEQYAQLARAT
jgi:hypothetical protein